MHRPLLTVCAVIASLNWAPATDRTTAQATAREHLAKNRPAAAVAALEEQLAGADGDRDFLELLRTAYAAELKAAETSPSDPKRLADLRTKLALLGGPPASTPAAVPVPPAPLPEPALPPATGSSDPLSQGLKALKEATALFQQGKNEPQKFDLAAALFAVAFREKVQMSSDQLTAWSYCRIRIAADRFNKAPNNSEVAAEVVAEVTEALQHAPQNTGLQKVGQELLAVARPRAGEAARSPATDGNWQVLETASFRILYQGSRGVADEVARIVESKRAELFNRWSGPPAGAWTPKCEIRLHTNATALAAATKLPPGATGRAEVQLAEGRAASRRIDLRSDDTTLIEDAFPRELTHVILADLFPNAAPPKWAEIGMAVLASSSAEVERYRRTVARCYQDRELIPLETLFELQDAPPERITGFVVGSVSLVEFLVKAKGERAFKTFLGDAKRYGFAGSLKRQYNFADARELEQQWLRSVVSAE